jgi:hypothetical protein
MSQEEAAEAVGVSPTTWARWERGDQGIRARHRGLIAAAFKAGADEVERWVDGWSAGGTASWPFADCGTASPVVTVKAAEHLWRLEMDPSRRHLLATLPFVPSALGEWLTSWAYDIRSPYAAAQGSGRLVGLADVARIDDARKAFAQMDRQFGAGLVRPVVMRYLNGVVKPLLHGRYDEQVGARLMGAVAGMSRMAGWTAFDMGQHGQAQQHFGMALKLSKAADDPITAAWVLGAMTVQAIHIDQPVWAVRVAGVAVDSARRAQATPRVMALLKVKQAWATALCTRPGESRDRHSIGEIERLLGESDHLFALGTRDADPPWAATFDLPEYTAQTGRCWDLLGEHRRAADSAEAAAAAFAGGSPRSAQFNRVHAAESYLAVGELEHALDSARSAVLMTKALNSARAVEFVERFSAQLEPYNDTIAVREFRDHVRIELAA